jgi:hypothetical protein
VADVTRIQTCSSPADLLRSAPHTRGDDIAAVFLEAFETITELRQSGWLSR